MADPSPDPPDAEAALLIDLWTELDAAEALATGANAMDCLDQVLEYCEAAAALIRRWRQPG